MYKIMIYIDTHSGDKWFYYQENEKDYVAYSLHEIKDTVLTLIDTYGKDNIKIVKQVTGEDMEGSVETFIYDSTDNYEELLNRPSINGVEVIGQLSLDDLGIQPAGDYATNEEVLLINGTTEYTPTSDYHPATKKYVDDNVVTKQDTLTAGENITIDENNVISASGGEGFPTISVNWIADTYSGGTSYLRNDETGCNNASKLINDIYKSGYKGRIKVIHSTSQKYTQLLQPGFTTIADTVTTYNFTNFTQEENRTYFNITDNLVPIRVYHLCIKGTWENDVFTCTQYGYGRTWTDNLVTKNGLLTKDNTTSYTPTSNYHPATKKYVDDRVDGIESFPTVQINKIHSQYSGGTINETDAETCARLSDLINNIYQSGYIGPVKVLHPEQVCTKILNPSFSAITNTTNSYLYTMLTNQESKSYISISDYLLNVRIYHLYIEGTWENDVFTCTGYRYERTNGNHQLVAQQAVLLKKNTTEYTPTGDYHPATKKYVDDSIAAIDIPTGSSNAIEQVETLPSGSEELVGTVYQYIGATNTSYGYVHGNYYICTKKMYLNRHNDRFTTYPWVNAQYENIVKEIPMHEYRNTSGVNFLTPGEHQVWGGTTFDVASDLSKILKRYTSDYNTALFLYSERLTSDTQEYVSVLFTVSYNTIIDNVEYQVFEGITHSIKNPGKTAHVVLRTAINGFNDYSCSPVFIVTEQSGANLDNYYTKEEVDAAIAAAITGALEGEY